MNGGKERVFATQAKRFAALAAVITLAFAIPLWTLLRYSLRSDFFSYIPLVPIISAYFIGLERSKAPNTTEPNWAGTIFAGAVGSVSLVLGLWLAHSGRGMDESTYLALLTASYLLFLVAGAFCFLGTAVLRMLCFPVAFLAFFIPPPAFLLEPTVEFFQHASAWTAVAMLKVVGTPVLVAGAGLDLQLPGMYLRVAPECSGIHSTMVLLMTAFLAGHMFLQSNLRRAALVVFVIPLAILRNGFRIFVIGELCVHLGPEMIDSPIHRHGGPIFFALSLIPFFWALMMLRKTESPGNADPPVGSPVSNPL